MANKLVWAVLALAVLGVVSAPAWAQSEPPAADTPPAGDTTTVNVDQGSNPDQGPGFYGMSGGAFWVLVLVVVVVLALLLFAIASGGHRHY